MKPRNSIEKTNPFEYVGIAFRNILCKFDRFYGPRGDDRIDRQLTYLWIVQFSKPKRKLDFKFDHEAEDNKWVSIEDLAGWLSEDERKAKEFTKFWKAKDGVRDSGGFR